MPFKPFNARMYDNRPQLGVYMDANPLSEGMANLAASMMQAGQARAQGERDKAAYELEQALNQERLLGMQQNRNLSGLNFNLRQDQMTHQQLMDKERMANELERLGLAQDQFREQVDQRDLDNAFREDQLIFDLDKERYRREQAALAQRQPTEPKLHTISEYGPWNNKTGEKKYRWDNGQLVEVPLAGGAGGTAAPAGDLTPQMTPEESALIIEQALSEGDINSGVIDQAMPADEGVMDQPSDNTTLKALGLTAGTAGATYGAGKAATALAPYLPDAAGVRSLVQSTPGIARLAAPVAGAISTTAKAAGIPGAIAYGGYKAAEHGYNKTSSENTPAQGSPIQVIKQYANGRTVVPSGATMTGAAFADILPEWAGGLKGSTEDHIGMLTKRNADEIMSALQQEVQSFPDGEAIMRQAGQLMYSNPEAFQQLMADVYQAVADRKLNALGNGQGVDAFGPETLKVMAELYGE